MGKVKILFLAAVVFLLNPLPAHSETYEDSTNGYRLEYPSGWRIKVKSGSGDTVKLNITKDYIIGIQVRIYQNQGDFNSFIGPYTEDFIKQMQKRWGGEPKVMDINSIWVSRIGGLSETFDFVKGDNTRLFLKHYFIPKNDKVFVFQGGGPYDDRFSYEPDFDSIVQSLILE